MQVLRTNNDVEGWHSRLNKKSGSAVGLNFNRLVSLLYDEISLIPLQTALLSQNQELRQKHPIAKCAQNNLVNAWEKFHSKGVKSLQLLKDLVSKFKQTPDDDRGDEPDTDDKAKN